MENLSSFCVGFFKVLLLKTSYVDFGLWGFGVLVIKLKLAVV